MLKTIAGIEVELREPYLCGEPLDEIAAKVLNRVRAKNLTNVLRSKVEKMLEDQLSPLEIEQYVRSTDENYELSISSVLDPIEREAYAIATNFVKEHLANSGRKLDVAPQGFSLEEWQQACAESIDDAAQQAPVLELAKKNVEARKRVANTMKEKLELTE